MQKVIKKEMKIKGKTVTGVEISWDNGQCIFIVANKGLLACGAIDLKVMEEFNFAVAISRGTPEKPLVTTEDLLDAKIVGATLEAHKLGIIEGMYGRDVLEKLL
jgi:uncharacterized protein YunC (DUF1805 family)